MNGNTKWIIGLLVVIMLGVSGWLGARVAHIEDTTVTIERYKGDIQSLQRGQRAIVKSIDAVRDTVYKLHMNKE